MLPNFLHVERNRTSMFHKFSAVPANADRQTKGPGSARARSKKKNNNDISDTDPNPSVAKRQKAARACDRCRLLRIKCDEQKPCTRSGSTSSPTGNPNPVGPTVPPSRVSMVTETRTPENEASKEFFNIAHVQGFFASGQPAFSYNSALGGCLFPQLPHPTLPSAECTVALRVLLKSQQSYYLRVFWEVCHQIMPIMSKTEFAQLDALPPSTIHDRHSTGGALVNSMIALGIQHTHVTGLVGRVSGLQQSPSRRNYHAGLPPKATWPGFEYFHRCRECMRANTEVTLEALRCHVLMVLYLVKGNAFHDAYNLLGITVRKAYIAKLHRPQLSHLPEAGKTARMQLWWIIFSLDVQCSLQLDMPPASQKSLVKCPFPDEDALARYISSPCEDGINAYAFSTHMVNIAVIVTDIGACVSTADLLDDDNSNSPAALEHHALNLSSALQSLDVWRDQLPSGLLLSRRGNGPGNSEMLDFDRTVTLPNWLQRQAVLLRLHYHNAYTLIQRPFIRLRHAHFNGTSSMINPPGSQQPHVELHIASALHHATIIVDMVFTLCSRSDIFYGWSEVIQPLWNATLTIVSYVSTNSPSSEVPRALDSLTCALDVFELFSHTSPTALSAKGIVKSLVDSLQNMKAQGACAVANGDLMGWELFASSLEDQQAVPIGLETTPSSNDLYGSVSFPPFMPAA
ncbi:unnamed protein product [Penicillium palitans]